VIVYYVVVSAGFAFLGIVAGNGNPLGALTGLGVLVLSHLILLAEVPHIAPSGFIGAAIIAALAMWLAFKLNRSWWQIGLVLALLLAWLVAGVAKLSTAT